MYNYFISLYKQLTLYLSSWLSTMNTNKMLNTNSKIINKSKKCKPSSFLLRNTFSPYTENETKTIRNNNYIITDEKRRSRLGKLVSYPYSPGIKSVENGHFCSFIREWFVVE